MAKLFQDDLQSSDSEDDDYVPDPGEVSSDDNDEENPLPPGDKITTNIKAKKSGVIGSENEKKKVFEESASTETKVDQKLRASNLFKSFLEEVEVEMKIKESGISPISMYDSPALSSNSGIKSKRTSYENTPAKPSCELFDFAGETIAILVEDGTKIASTNESVDSDFKKYKPVNLEENVLDESANQLPVMKRKGLQSVLCTIKNKKQKLTTLEKSSLDWSLFKKEHGIFGELEKFNKGRGGYIERQRFLQRSDVRNYEIERDIRLSKNKRTC